MEVIFSLIGEYGPGCERERPQIDIKESDSCGLKNGELVEYPIPQWGVKGFMFFLHCTSNNKTFRLVLVPEDGRKGTLHEIVDTLDAELELAYQWFESEPLLGDTYILGRPSGIKHDPNRYGDNPKLTRNNFNSNDILVIADRKIQLQFRFRDTT